MMVSYYPTLVGENQEKHEYLYWEFPAYGGQQGYKNKSMEREQRTPFKGPSKT